jgi:hypothetical protein
MNMKAKLITAFVLTLALRLPAQNLLVNGSFETGDFTGWNASGNVAVDSGEGASDGIYSAVYNAGETPPTGVVSQSFATTPGDEYSLSFDYGLFIVIPPGVPQTLDVLVDGTSPLLSTTATTTTGGAFPTPFTHFTYSFQADSTSTLLQFTDDPGNYTVSEDGILDNVVVAAIPDSGSTVALMTMALLGVGGFSRKLRRQPVA